MKSVKLYGYSTSPYVRKTGCFLYYKDISFEHIPVNPLESETTIGFTRQTQVPVLQIDDEWRLESSDHAYWLDEHFPDKPLCPANHRSKIEEIDRWISDTFLLSIFRYSIDGEMNHGFRQAGWRLAAIVSAQTALSEKDRHRWPEMLQKVPFIQEMAKHMDLTESFQDMQLRIAGELVAHIGDGPYLGSLDQPTMLDFAIFPQLVWSYMFGLSEHLTAAAHPVVKAWLQRVFKHLPDNPTLTPDFLKVHSVAEGLA